jgi:hypothetical protein
MIKFFRKIRQNLLSKGKTGKYLKYALGEIVLVVIGILIALSLNNWKENKKEQQEEYLALKSLHSEFIESRKRFNLIQGHNEYIFDGMRNLLKILDENSATDSLADSIYINLDISSWSSPTFEPSRGIINSLINSGKLNIISNENLKVQLVQWNDQVINFQNWQRLAQDYKFTYLFPLISKATVLPSKIKKFDSNVEYNRDEMSHSDIDLSIINSKEFYNYLNQCWVYSVTILEKDEQISLGKDVRETLDNIIFLIEKELEK